MTEQCAAVLFDMDGVTVETAALWRRIEREQIFPEVTNGKVPVSSIRAKSLGDMYTQLAAEDKVTLTVTREEFDEIFDKWADIVYHERATLLPQYHELVEDIKTTETPVGLVSASRREWVEMVLDRFELDGLYDVIITPSDVEGPSKPSPDIYQYAANELKVSPQRCLAVEDSKHGVQAATNAGMHCIALRGDGNDSVDLTHADEVVTNHRSLRETILAHTQPARIQ